MANANDPGEMQPPPFGILNLNKPAGMTSRRAVNVVQRLVKPAKVGHAGTLDPLATGVLVIAVGRATRLIEQIQSRSKRYRATFLLGCRSDTDDASGDVTIVTETPDVDADQIAVAMSDFVGRIDQVPPDFSAVHVKGRRAYKLARRGKQVELKPRPVEVYSIELVEFDSPEVVLDIHCGSGTYIRSIARDLGERLGCGALMSKLVRTAVGPYRLEDAIAPDDVTEETLAYLLISPITAVDHLPQYRCTASEFEEIINGRTFELAVDAFEAGVAGIDDGEPADVEQASSLAFPNGEHKRGRLCYDHRRSGTSANRLFPPDGQTLVLLTPEGELAALAAYSVDDGVVAPKQVYCDVPQ